MSAYNLFVIYSEVNLSEKGVMNELAKKIILKAADFNFNAIFHYQNSIFDQLLKDMKRTENKSYLPHFVLSDLFEAFDSEDLVNLPYNNEIDDYRDKYRVITEVLNILLSQSYINRVDFYLSRMPYDAISNFDTIRTTTDKLINDMFEHIKAQAGINKVWEMEAFKFIITME